jgi:hypothetical protein
MHCPFDGLEYLSKFTDRGQMMTNRKCNKATSKRPVSSFDDDLDFDGPPVNIVFSDQWKREYREPIGIAAAMKYGDAIRKDEVVLINQAVALSNDLARRFYIDDGGLVRVTPGVQIDSLPAPVESIAIWAEGHSSWHFNKRRHESYSDLAQNILLSNLTMDWLPSSWNSLSLNQREAAIQAQMEKSRHGILLLLAEQIRLANKVEPLYEEQTAHMVRPWRLYE